MLALSLFPSFLDPEFKVTLNAAVTPQFTYDPTEFHCEVANILHLRNGRLGVSWHYSEALPGDASDTAETIGTLNEHGALVPGTAYQKRLESGDISLSRGEPNVFKLRILRTRTQDMGSYTCSVTARTPSRQGGWDQAKVVPSTPIKVQWSSKSKWKCVCVCGEGCLWLVVWIFSLIHLFFSVWPYWGEDKCMCVIFFCLIWEIFLATGLFSPSRSVLGHILFCCIHAISRSCISFMCSGKLCCFLFLQ